MRQAGTGFLFHVPSSCTIATVKLQRRTALVTGAGSGIGKAIALEFAREGAKVIASDINEQSARSVAEEIAAAGGEARPLRTDTSQQAEVQAAIAAAVEAWGRLDILVNNAGITAFEHTWDEVIAVNLSGVYYGCLHGLQQMKRQDGGVIVNLASIAGLVGASAPGIPGGFGYPYGASKHGVIGLTKQFALDGAPEVRVNCICPAFVETPMVAIVTETPPLLDWAVQNTPMGRLGRPEEVARAALFLASDDSSFMTGAHLVVDGGWTAR